MQNERGFTLVELVIVVAVAALVLMATAAYSVPMLARETMRSATYDVQTYMQLARIEAVSRNHECRFVIRTNNRRIAVVDGMGTASAIDDETLYETTLPQAVAFARPDGGAAVTLDSVGDQPSAYQLVFSPEGTVTSGTGDVVLFGGEHYRRVAAYAAGGIQVLHWNGSSWVSGS